MFIGYKAFMIFNFIVMWGNVHISNGKVHTHKIIIYKIVKVMGKQSFCYKIPFNNRINLNFKKTLVNITDKQENITYYYRKLWVQIINIYSINGFGT